MFNPFKAVGNAIASAGRGIAGAGRAVGKFVSKPFTREKAPSRPPTPSRPPAAPKAPTRVMPTVTPPAAPPAAAPGKKLPPSMVRGTRGAAGGRTGGMIADDAILGADSDQVKDLLEAVKEFESEHIVQGLNRSALNFLDHPSFNAIFDKYTTGSGFSTDQWVGGMSNVRNIRIDRIADGHVHVVFDADYEIDDYDLGTRSASATF